VDCMVFSDCVLDLSQVQGRDIHCLELASARLRYADTIICIVMADNSAVCQFEALHVYSNQSYSFSRDKISWLDSGRWKIGLGGITLFYILWEIPILLVVIKESVMPDIAVFPWLPCVCWSSATFSTSAVMIHGILLQPGAGDLVPMWYLTQEEVLGQRYIPHAEYLHGTLLLLQWILSYALLYHYQQMPERCCLITIESTMMRADKFCGSFHWFKSLLLHLLLLDMKLEKNGKPHAAGYELFLKCSEVGLLRSDERSSVDTSGNYILLRPMLPSRSDSYMTDAPIHWFSIPNYLMNVIFLSGLLVMIIMRTLYKDIANYNQLDNQNEAQEETGWKLVHCDVFMPPIHSGLLCVYVDNGVLSCGAAPTAGAGKISNICPIGNICLISNICPIGNIFPISNICPIGNIFPIGNI
jgi:hypothetical protein